MSDYLTTDEILDATGLPFYKLEYLIKLRIITPKRFGKGLPRRYSPQDVATIRQWLKTRGLSG